MAITNTLPASVGSYPVTPSDTLDLVHTNPSNGLTTAVVAQGIRVDGTAGTVKMTFADGSVDTWNVALGERIHAKVTRVWATGTTATGIKRLQ